MAKYLPSKLTLSGAENIATTVGDMVTSNTESGITVAFDNADNTLDFTVGTLNQNTTGSAAKLTTAVNIGGVSFDGSADITLVSGSIPNNAADTTGLAGTATILATARAIGGVDFNGSAAIDLPGVNAAGNQNTSGTAAIATTVTVSDNESENESNVITFVAGAAGSGNVSLEADGDLTYNPSTGKVTATGFVGALTGNADTVTNATLTTALTVNTGTLTLTANSANDSVLTIGSGAVSISGSNTGDQSASDVLTLIENGVDSVHYVDGSIDTAHIANDQITAGLMADNSVDSDMYVDGSIDTAHIADSQVTYAKMQDTGTANRVLGAASAGTIGEVQVVVGMMANDSIDSDQYVDGSIDTAHIGDDQVTYAKIQNVSATNVVLGRDSANAGVIEEISASDLKTMLGLTNAVVAGSAADWTSAGAQTGITSLLNTGLVLGRDADNTINFGTTDDEIHFQAGGTTGVKVLSDGVIKATALTLGDVTVTSTGTELNALDGITAVVAELNFLDLGTTAVGNAIASKAVVLDANKDYTGVRNLTVTGKSTLTAREFPIANGTDGNHTGDVVYFGSTTSMTIGALYHYKSDSSWELADADAVATCDGLLAVALGAASDTNGMLLRGMVTLDHDPGAVGDVLFVSTTAGDVSATAPSGNGDIIRVIGYCLHASNGTIWFNPDSTFVEVTA